MKKLLSVFAALGFALSLYGTAAACPGMEEAPKSTMAKHNKKSKNKTAAKATKPAPVKQATPAKAKSKAKPKTKTKTATKTAATKVSQK
jgi:hypothetical protein